jgi:hypothetical protein
MFETIKQTWNDAMYVELPEELVLLDKMTLNVCKKWTNGSCNVFLPETIVPFLKKYIDLKKKEKLTMEETNDCGIVDSYMMVGKKFWKLNVNTHRAYKTPIINFLTLNYSINLASNSVSYSYVKSCDDTMYELKNQDLTHKMKKEVTEYRVIISKLTGL